MIYTYEPEIRTFYDYSSQKMHHNDNIKELDENEP